MGTTYAGPLSMSAQSKSSESVISLRTGVTQPIGKFERNETYHDGPAVEVLFTQC